MTIKNSCITKKDLCDDRTREEAEDRISTYSQLSEEFKRQIHYIKTY